MAHQERDAFDAWWGTRMGHKPARNLEPGYYEEYENPSANMAWKGWQARAARQDGAWQPIESFPQDGEDYLATDNRVQDGFPQVVYWDDWRLHVPDAGISYMPDFFTHWRPLPAPPQS